MSSYQFLKVWGCLAKVVVPIPKRIKIGSKSVDCVFIGYAYNSSAYRFLIHKSDVLDMNVNTIIESRNVVFLKKYFLTNPHKHRVLLRETLSLRLVALMIKS